MVSPLRVVVNGLAGHLCTMEATTGWTLQQVQEVLLERLSVPLSRQTMLKETTMLAAEVPLASLLSEDPTTALILTLIILQAPQGLVTFSGCCNGLEQLEPGRLKKTAEASLLWNATAVSSEGFEVGKGKGLRFRPAHADKSLMIGLGASSSPPANFEEIEFAACCYSDGNFEVFERGSCQFTRWRSYTPSSLVELVVTDKIEYFLDGLLHYTSTLTGQDILYAKASFHSPDAEALEIYWL